MKIGILTFHYAHNYGAMLQAYALVTKLNKIGYDAEIIDYRLPFIYENHEKITFANLFKRYKRSNSNLISLLKCVKNYKRTVVKDKKWYRFESFLENELKKTDRYVSIDLSKIDYEAIICGSDQIWNAKLTNGLQEIYFAYSANERCKRIAYAASTGTDHIGSSMLSTFLLYLSKMTYVSIREDRLITFLNNICNINIAHVLDPIFLLSKNEWESVTTDSSIYDYVLIYSFDEDSHFIETVNNLIMKMNKQAIYLSFHNNDNINTDIIQIIDSGPKEFLGYFKNADFVITNSFHGTAFSILYQKQFISVLPKSNQERIVSILKLFELSDRIFQNDLDTENIIDYKQIDVKLQFFKNESLNFLHKSLSD